MRFRGYLLKFWVDYDKSNRNQAIREKIILEYAPLVKLVAGRLSMYLGYNVEYEDSLALVDMGK